MLRRNRFTLTELLVVMGIIAVLAGMLLPALNGARARARASKCLSNKKQAIAAQIQYSNDYRHYFIGFQVPPKVNNGNYGLWLCYLAFSRNSEGKYSPSGGYTSLAALQCPLMKQPNADSVNLSDLFHCTFGMEYTGGGGETIDKDRKEKLGKYIWEKKKNGKETYVLRLMRMKNPSDIPIFADALTDPSQMSSTTHCRFKFKKHEGSMVMAHSGRNPIAFADGHADSHTGKELSSMPYGLEFWYEDTTGTEGKK